MPNTSPSSFGANSHHIDVHSLSLAQLQKLAEQGSRRARAELESRMQAAAPRRAAPAVPAAPMPMPTPVRAAAPARVAPAPAATEPAADAPSASASLADRLALIARQDEERSRAADAPRLVGMLMIALGALLLLGALVMLGYHSFSGGVYYLFCAVGAAAIGWLLLRGSRWAMMLHGALLIVALVWAWRNNVHGGFGLALMQAMPLLVPALWIIVPQVREPLE